MLDDVYTEVNGFARFHYTQPIIDDQVAWLCESIAFGPNAGKYGTKTGSGFDYSEEIPLGKGKRCYSVNGCSLHCTTSKNTHARERLEKLIEYIARGPLSNERIEIIADGKIKLRLKFSWRDGTSHYLLPKRIIRVPALYFACGCLRKRCFWQYLAQFCRKQLWAL